MRRADGRAGPPPVARPPATRCVLERHGRTAGRAATEVASRGAIVDASRHVPPMVETRGRGGRSERVFRSPRGSRLPHRFGLFCRRKVPRRTLLHGPRHSCGRRSRGRPRRGLCLRALGHRGGRERAARPRADDELPVRRIVLATLPARPAGGGAARRVRLLGGPPAVQPRVGARQPPCRALPRGLRVRRRLPRRSSGLRV